MGVYFNFKAIRQWYYGQLKSTSLLLGYNPSALKKELTYCIHVKNHTNLPQVCAPVLCILRFVHSWHSLAADTWTVREIFLLKPCSNA